MTDGSVENRELIPMGARVCVAEDRYRTREGVVSEHTDDERMYVNWDDDFIPDTYMLRHTGPFAIFELRRLS